MIIRNRRALDRGFIPEQLVDREAELEALRRIMRPMLRERLPSHAFIYGGVGVGKTTLVRFFMRNVEGVRKIYHSCLWARSSKDIILAILRGAGRKIPSLRGYSRGEMMALVSSASMGVHTLLVLDEANALLEEATEFLEALLREQPGGGFSIIIVSLNPPDQVLPRPLLSVLGYASSVQLRPYNAEILREILKQRADLSLVPGTWEEGLLELIAESAAAYGDARLAIEILQRAAERAEALGRGSIEPEDVRVAMAKINPFLTESKLSELPDGELMALLAVARALRGRAVASLRQIYEEYQGLAEEGLAEGASYSTIHRRILSLAEAGILSVRKVGERRRGVRLLVTIMDFPAGRLEELIMQRLKSRG